MIGHLQEITKNFCRNNICCLAKISILDIGYRPQQYRYPGIRAIIIVRYLRELNCINIVLSQYALQRSDSLRAPAIEVPQAFVSTVINTFTPIFSQCPKTLKGILLPSHHFTPRKESHLGISRAPDRLGVLFTLARQSRN